MNLEKINDAGNQEQIDLGQKLLREGAMATVVLAGGQGSRLGFDHPKGMFPISVVKNKTLFQLIAEKTVAASKLYQCELKLAIMTSPENHEETINYFQNNQFFGLSPNQLSFFTQSEMALENDQGEQLDCLASDGNGSVFKQLVTSSILDKWKEANVNYINIILVDNPLADPFDANLLGFTALHSLDVSIKCCKRKNPDEKVGLIFKQNEKLLVVEYSEQTEEEKKAGQLANLSLFCLKTTFFRFLAEQNFPLHRARKPLPDQTMGWKIEKFIFDLLEFTSNSAALVYKRETCFSPLKNAKGPDSAESVKLALQNCDLTLINQIIERPFYTSPFELACRYYYLSPEEKNLLKRAKIEESSFYLD